MFTLTLLTVFIKLPRNQMRLLDNLKTQFGETTGTGGLLESEQDNALPDMPNLKGRAKEGVRYTWIFPNITFANRDALWVIAYPLGSEKCKVVQTACFHPKSVSRIEFKSKLRRTYTDLTQP